MPKNIRILLMPIIRRKKAHRKPQIPHKASSTPPLPLKTTPVPPPPLKATPAPPPSLKDGFSYEPLSEEIILRIAGLSYPRDSITNPAKDVIPLQDLRYVKIRYIDFDGKAQNGELICNQKIAQDLVEIFSELYDRQYPLASVRLVDDFGGDDLASMEADNTSCFNFREVTASGGGSHKLSLHAYGLAVDLNPLYNPYVKKGKILPQSAKPYANRKNANPYRIDHEDLAYQLFTAHGFTWGGDWKSLKDYQHFEKK